MRSSRIGQRYARALFRLAAGDHAKARSFLEVLQNIAALFSNHDIAQVLESPVIPIPLKQEVLKAVLDKFENKDRIFAAFLKQVIASGRTEFFPVIAASLEGLIDEASGILRAELQTATAISDAESFEIQKTLEGKFGKKITLQRTVHPEILGGFLVNVGNSVIDLTLKSRIAALAEQAIQA